jgi:5-methylcytosine-specific restriction endonuclease McrA
MNYRNKTLRRKCFERDNFTCRKCKFLDKTGYSLEAHHIIPLCAGGEDVLGNLITLCFDCHKFAPNKKEEFEEYLREEMDGTSTTLLRAWNKLRKENPQLFEETSSETPEKPSETEN